MELYYNKQEVCLYLNIENTKFCIFRFSGQQHIYITEYYLSITTFELLVSAYNLDMITDILIKYAAIEILACVNPLNIYVRGSINTVYLNLFHTTYIAFTNSSITLIRFYPGRIQEFSAQLRNIDKFKILSETEQHNIIQLLTTSSGVNLAIAMLE